MIAKTTYVIVPVHFDQDGNVFDVALDDDGDPGPWGDTYDRTTEDWVFDDEAQSKAIGFIGDIIASGE